MTNASPDVKFLAAVTVILLVPTVISTLYGVNARLPLETHPLASWR